LGIPWFYYKIWPYNICLDLDCQWHLWWVWIGLTKKKADLAKACTYRKCKMRLKSIKIHWCLGYRTVRIPRPPFVMYYPHKSSERLDTETTLLCGYRGLCSDTEAVLVSEQNTETTLLCGYRGLCSDTEVVLVSEQNTEIHPVGYRDPFEYRDPFGYRDAFEYRDQLGYRDPPLFVYRGGLVASIRIPRPLNMVF